MDDIMRTIGDMRELEITWAEEVRAGETTLSFPEWVDDYKERLSASLDELSKKRKE